MILPFDLDFDCLLAYRESKWRDWNDALSSRRIASCKKKGRGAKATRHPETVKSIVELRRDQSSRESPEPVVPQKIPPAEADLIRPRASRARSDLSILRSYQLDRLLLSAPTRRPHVISDSFTYHALRSRTASIWKIRNFSTRRPDREWFLPSFLVFQGFSSLIAIHPIAPICPASSTVRRWWISRGEGSDVTTASERWRRSAGRSRPFRGSCLFVFSSSPEVSASVPNWIPCYVTGGHGRSLGFGRWNGGCGFAAIECVREQMGDDESVNDAPVLEEFIPLKPSLASTSSEGSSEAKKAAMVRRLETKPDWLRSVQLWDQQPDTVLKVVRCWIVVSF